MKHKEGMLEGVMYGLFMIATLTVVVIVLATDPRPGIGDPDQAIAKIRKARTKEDVFILLGKPHCRLGSRHGAEVWYYRCTFAGSEMVSVSFGPDEFLEYAESFTQ